MSVHVCIEVQLASWSTAIRWGGVKRRLGDRYSSSVLLQQSSNPRSPRGPSAARLLCLCDLAAGRRLTCCMKAGYEYVKTRSKSCWPRVKLSWMCNETQLPVSICYWCWGKVIIKWHPSINIKLLTAEINNTKTLLQHYSIVSNTKTHINISSKRK